MTTITATIAKKKDVKVLQEILERFGIEYIIDEGATDYVFSADELKDFEQTKQDFLEGKTTARSWDEIQKDLKRAFH